MKALLQFIKPYLYILRKTVILYVCSTCILRVISLVTPYISGIYVDLLISRDSVNMILYFVLLIGIINIVNILFQYLTALIITRFNNSLSYEIYNNIFQKIFISKLSLFKDKDNSYLIDQINNDTNIIVTFCSDNISNLFLQILTIIMSGFIVFQADIFLCIIIFSLVPIYILTYLIFSKKLYSANLLFREESNKYYSKKAEQITKLEFIKKNAISVEMRERFRESFKFLYNIANNQVKTSYIFSNLSQFILIICYMCVIGIGGYKVMTKNLSIGFYTIINTYFSMIISSATYFLNLASLYQQVKVSVTRLNSILNFENEIYGDKNIDNLDNIQICNLSIAYSDNIVFKNLNYEFSKGKIYGLKGINGSGKTTLINSIIGLYGDMYDGDIFFNRISIKELDMPNIRRLKISFVEQNPEFLNLSIENYLTFGINLSDDNKKVQKELIEKFGVIELIDRAKDFVVNESGNNLSGGEKQKIALTRALSKPSFLTILDEPTSALDTESVNNLIQILTQQKLSKITIIVSHDERILNICDDILYLSNNRGENDK